MKLLGTTTLMGTELGKDGGTLAVKIFEVCEQIYEQSEREGGTVQDPGWSREGTVLGKGGG